METEVKETEVKETEVKETEVKETENLFALPEIEIKVPKKRGRKKKTEINDTEIKTEVKKEIKQIDFKIPEKITEIFFNEIVIKKLIKSDDILKEFEVTLLNDSISKVLSKYLPEQLEKNSEIANLLFSLVVVLIPRIDFKK